MPRLTSHPHARRFWFGLCLALFLAVRAHAMPVATLTASPNPVKETKPFTLIATATTTLPGETITHTRYREISPSVLVLYDSSVTLSVPVTAPSVSATTTAVYELTVTSLDTLASTRTVVVKRNVTINNNVAPVVNAGPATLSVTEGSLVTFSSATATDADGDALTYTWTQVSGPQILTISNSTSLNTANFTAPNVSANEVYAIRLSVTDGLAVVSDTITVTVTSVNHPPVADAGPNQSVTEGTFVHLTAAGSTDPDGDALTFAWAQSATPAGQPTVMLRSSGTVTPSFTALAVTLSGSILRFRVTVSDGKGGSSSATVDVQVQNSSAPNHPPVVNAGTDQTVDDKTIVTLKGTASDPDGTAVVVTWTKLSGPRDISINNASALQATFTAPDIDQDELYVFRLSGSDGFLVATDTMTVLIRATPNPADAASGLPLIANPRVYPSPFSPAAGGATIGYTLRSPSDVTVLISDIFGRQVREFHVAAGTTGGAAGDNALPWDGRSGDGETIGNGAYIVQIQATDGLGAKGKITDRVGVRR